MLPRSLYIVLAGWGTHYYMDLFRKVNVMSDEKVTMYGIWIPGTGWLRGKDGEPFADYSLPVSKQVSKCIGLKSKVLFIDLSIVDFEKKYLDNERRTIWHIFRNYLERKNNSSNNKG